MFPTMRFAGLLTLLALLAIPAPALAASNADVTIGDDFYESPTATAPTVKIQPGDTVTWHWTGMDQHTVTASPNQTVSFSSPFKTSGTFKRGFPKPGRFIYHCQVHDQMRGAVEVGPPPFPDTSLPRISRYKARVSGSTMKVSFKLSEKSRVRVAVSGPSDKVVTRLLGTGKRSITFRHLKAGRYRAGLRLRDTAGNKGHSPKTKRVRVR
jgi:plastocyanin